MAFESGIVLEDWRSAVIVPLYKGKEERTECSNYRDITLLSVVGKIYAESIKYLMGLIDVKEEGVCRSESRLVRKHNRKNVVYVGFMNLEKAYDRVNREAV